VIYAVFAYLNNQYLVFIFITAAKNHQENHFSFELNFLRMTLADFQETIKNKQLPDNISVYLKVLSYMHLANGTMPIIMSTPPIRRSSHAP